MRCPGWGVAAIVALWSFAAGAVGSFAAGAVEPILVTHNKAHILRLDQDIGTFIITNPAVLDVQLHTPRMAVMLGLAAGETQLLILDKRHNEILSTVVIVTPELDRNVSIIRSCGSGGGGGNCLAEEELNCGPRCVRVPVPGTKESNASSAGGGNAPAPAPASAADAGAVELQ